MKLKFVTAMTPYEKFLRLPKIVKREIKGIELEFYFDLLFNTKYNDDCCIEYNRQDILGDYHTLKGLRWNGTIEECINMAYDYFRNSSELLECENT